MPRFVSAGERNRLPHALPDGYEGDVAGKILSMGEALVDVLPAGQGLWRPVGGGSSYNFARAVGRLGVGCGFAGRLSRDDQGVRMRRALLVDGVDVELCAHDDRPSPLSLVEAGSETASARFSIYLDGTAHAPPDLPANWTDGAAHLHVSSFSSISGDWGASVLHALETARSRVSASLDINIRPSLIPPRAQALAAIETRLALVDAVKASDEDLAWLFPETAPLAAARAWARRFGRLVVVTQGRNGATAFHGERKIHAPGLPVAVADTVGAGDCFFAAFLSEAVPAGAFRGPPPHDADVRRWLEFANAAGALCCSRAGADPATRAEIETFVKSS